jgi:uncharacterized RDD family membrane protein YckC
MESPEARVTVETPEQVELQLDLAGAGSRFLAILIDSLIQILILVPLAFGLAFTLAIPEMVGLAVVLIIVVVFFWNGYFVLFEVLWHGQTPGKKAFHLRVVKDDGVPITALDALIRNVVRLVDFLPMGYMIGAVSVFLTRRHKRLGDFAAGTLVVKEGLAATSAGLEARASLVDREPECSLAGIERLEGDEITFLKEFLARGERLPEESRRVVERNLAGRLREKVQVRSGEEPSDRGFLEEVYLALTREESLR